MQRQFNVYSPLVVTWQGEEIEWVVTQKELGTAPSVTVSPLPNGSWPFENPSYTVTPGTPVRAKVTGNLGVGFQCSPTAPNVNAQKIEITPHPGKGPCDSVSGYQGNYFVWINDLDETIVVKPNPNNSNYWPLASQQYAVLEQSWLAVEIPADAQPGNYGIAITNSKGQDVCTIEGQPVIIVQG